MECPDYICTQSTTDGRKDVPLARQQEKEGKRDEEGREQRDVTISLLKKSSNYNPLHCLHCDTATFFGTG